jgi:hypothetical protein
MIRPRSDGGARKEVNSADAFVLRRSGIASDTRGSQHDRESRIPDRLLEVQTVAEGDGVAAEAAGYHLDD